MSELIATLEYNGKQYVIQQDWPLYDGDDENDQRGHASYLWTEGNYGCDCNRFSFIEDAYDDPPVRENPDENEPSYRCGETIKLVSLTLDGKDLLAPTVHERLAAVGLFSYGGL